MESTQWRETMREKTQSFAQQHLPRISVRRTKFGRLTLFSAPMDDGFDVRAPASTMILPTPSPVAYTTWGAMEEECGHMEWARGHKHIGDLPRKRLPNF